MECENQLVHVCDGSNRNTFILSFSSSSSYMLFRFTSVRASDHTGQQHTTWHCVFEMADFLHRLCCSGVSGQQSPVSCSTSTDQWDLSRRPGAVGSSHADHVRVVLRKCWIRTWHENKGLADLSSISAITDLYVCVCVCSHLCLSLQRSGRRSGPSSPWTPGETGCSVTESHRNNRHTPPYTPPFSRP